MSFSSATEAWLNRRGDASTVSRTRAPRRSWWPPRSGMIPVMARALRAVARARAARVAASDSPLRTKLLGNLVRHGVPRLRMRPATHTRVPLSRW